MQQYKVIIVTDELQIEQTLNEQYAEGWRLNSVETEYTKFIIIFERIETNTL